jgi:putative RNA 2'-phosphotransferase
MERARALRISKLMSLGLRHQPEALGLTLDERGWTSIEALAAGLTASGLTATREDIEEIVETSDKQRFAISPDGLMIRANQGHSIAVDLGLPTREPPDVLYHGTVTAFLASIREKGLVRGARTHVHLSEDRETAARVSALAAEADVLAWNAGGFVETLMIQPEERAPLHLWAALRDEENTVDADSEREPSDRFDRALHRRGSQGFLVGACADKRGVRAVAVDDDAPDVNANANANAKNVRFGLHNAARMLPALFTHNSLLVMIYHSR